MPGREANGSQPLVRRGDRTWRLPSHRLRARNAGSALMGRDGGFAPAPGKLLCPPGRLEAAREARDDRGQGAGRADRSRRDGPAGVSRFPRAPGVAPDQTATGSKARGALNAGGSARLGGPRGLRRAPTSRGHTPHAPRPSTDGCPVRSSGATRGPGGSGPCRGARFGQSSKPWESLGNTTPCIRAVGQCRIRSTQYVVGSVSHSVDGSSGFSVGERGVISPGSRSSRDPRPNPRRPAGRGSAQASRARGGPFHAPKLAARQREGILLAEVTEVTRSAESRRHVVLSWPDPSDGYPLQTRKNPVD